MIPDTEEEPIKLPENQPFVVFDNEWEKQSFFDLFSILYDNDIYINYLWISLVIFNFSINFYFKKR